MTGRRTGITGNGHIGFLTRQVCHLTGGQSQNPSFVGPKRFCVSPSVRASQGTGSRRAYGFGDVVALAVVADLRQSGVSLELLKVVADTIRQMDLGSIKAKPYLLANRECVIQAAVESLPLAVDRPWVLVVNLASFVTRLKKELGILEISVV